ncbi:flagellar motor switch protein FliM [Neoasaia chiangmaiensis NBRC 101099]|uniref:Flagellar motor switch protein FliM n=1 Tax=Neoasaia chiangmaiensis TaxID=320497 RepID=A0A1U9KT36_9PROT|nr:FliM/FliN family flagellar motor switch protein [Neoasaia chiangmaiensis]AQS88877.1 hypothetical protein A0U93_14195 [Neoasaia chiangmaiensis]GBR40505.1 flagellar motor switch protein FliM [Neoasaia chiangmaiensis NBRC 101099]GEN13867.1 hypothetical protein NCH01_02980 [Neoasaia chiangmaiensis]
MIDESIAMAHSRVGAGSNQQVRHESEVNYRRIGIENLIGASHVSYERLPMLEVVFDRLMRSLATSLRNYTNDTIDVVMKQLTSEKFGDVFGPESRNALFAVFKAEEWENYGVLILSSPLVYMVVDALLGGKNHSLDPTLAASLAQRPHTTIERALITPLIHTILSDLGDSFNPLCAVSFRFERLESNDRFAAIARANNGVVSAQFSINMGGSSGLANLILPHATLEPVRDVLLQQFIGEKFGHDATWEYRLAQELRSTEIELDAVFDEQVMSLGDVMNLKVGQQIMLQRQSNCSARIRCGGKDLFEGRVGQRRGRVAIKIENDLRSLSENYDLEDIAINQGKQDE